MSTVAAVDAEGLGRLEALAVALGLERLHLTQNRVVGSSPVRGRNCVGHRRELWVGCPSEAIAALAEASADPSYTCRWAGRARRRRWSACACAGTSSRRPRASASAAAPCPAPAIAFNVPLLRSVGRCDRRKPLRDIHLVYLPERDLPQELLSRRRYVLALLRRQITQRVLESERRLKLTDKVEL